MATKVEGRAQEALGKLQKLLSPAEVGQLQKLLSSARVSADDLKKAGEILDKGLKAVGDRVWSPEHNWIFDAKALKGAMGAEKLRKTARALLDLGSSAVANVLLMHSAYKKKDG